MPHLDSSALDTDPTGMAFLRDALSDLGVSQGCAVQTTVTGSGLFEVIVEQSAVPSAAAAGVPSGPPLAIAS